MTTAASASSRPASLAPDFGALRRLQPFSTVFGSDRGTCIDRYYIERFLAANSSDIHGRVLEVAEDTYTRRFGAEKVTRADILHLPPGTRRTTIAGDLTTGKGIPEQAFDCFVLTQTLLCIYDIHLAIQGVRRLLAPGGVVLATVPGISQVSRFDMDRWGDYWRFTDRSARRLFEEAFAPADVRVATHGNVLAAAAFLYGLAAEELRPEELEHQDRDYPLLITIRAVKSGTGP